MKIVQKSLDELGYVGRGKSQYRPRDAVQLYDGPYPFIQTSDVKNAGLYIRKYTQTYSHEGLAQSKLWKAGTLCITVAANIADTSILSFDACFPDSIIGFIPDKKKADARYIKYLFDLVIQQRFKNFSKGSTQDNLSREKLLSLKLSLIENVETQKNIADQLEVYDNIIYNNTGRIQLLEEIARLLFSEWFVHLRFPDHKKVKLINDTPEGWEKKTLGEISKRIKKSYSINDEDLPLIDLARIQSRTLAATEVGVSSDLETARIIFERDDILFSSIRPYLHKVILAPCKGITNTSVFVVRSKKQNFRAYLTLLMFSDYAVQFANQHSTGTKMPVVKWNSVSMIPAWIPPESIMDEFQNIVGPILEQIQTSFFLNQKLIQARDLLLTKLMSGKTEL
jgi:type I restriction enzyme S subunit